MMSKREKIKSKKITDVLISSETIGREKRSSLRRLLMYSSLVKLQKLKDSYLKVVIIVKRLSIWLRMMK
jgi:hypothetical protein